jgi:hypothetical protein
MAAPTRASPGGEGDSGEQEPRSHSSVKVVCIMIPRVKDYFEMDPFVESMAGLGATGTIWELNFNEASCFDVHT